MVDAANPGKILSKRKAIDSILPFAIFLEQNGQRGMFEAFTHAIRAPNYPTFYWHGTGRCIDRMFGQSSPPSLDRAITLISPHVRWDSGLHGKDTVTRWGAAALAVPYTEEVGQSVVDALLQIASFDFLRSYIPIELWAWLKKRPTLPPACQGRSLGTMPGVVSFIRRLGDAEILKAYFLLVWSEWDQLLWDGSVDEMVISIREDFGGLGISHHREDLLERLDQVLAQLDRGSEHLKQQKPTIEEAGVQVAKGQYGALKKVLLEVGDRGAMETLTRTLPNMHLAFIGYADSCERL